MNILLTRKAGATKNTRSEKEYEMSMQDYLYYTIRAITCVNLPSFNFMSFSLP